MSISSVNDVLKKPFKTYTKDEQLEIVKAGRFTDLTNLCQNDKGKYRTFSVNWYQRVKWLTGNTVNRKLYCWSCVLFPSGPSKIWNSTGFDDLKNLSQAIKKHEDTKEHTYSTVKLNLFLRNKKIANEQQREGYNNNVKVRRNREYLERLIDVASALAHYEIPFRRENDDGFYKYLVGVFKKYDDIVRTQIEEDSPFKGLTKTIQIDLLQSIAHTVLQHIVSEVAAANFFALQVDEVTCCSRTSRQVAVSLRFIKDARPVERFIGMFDVSRNKKSDELTAILERELDKFNYKEKMIAQSFDGGVVKSTELYNLQQSLKRLQGTPAKCQFVNSYAHEFSTVLAQSLRAIQECKLFFAVIAQFSSFLKNPALKEALQNFDVSSVETTSMCIDNLRNNHLSILRLLEYINTSEEFETATDFISLAVTLISQLQNCKFMLLVAIFHLIFSAIHDSFENIRKQPWNTEKNRIEINNLTAKLKQMKEGDIFNNLVADVPNYIGRPVILTNMMEIYVQIIDHVIYEIEGRFLDIEMAEFCSLVSYVIPQGAGTRKTPNNSLLTCIREIHPTVFDVVRLKAELELLYSDPAIAGIGEVEMRGAGDMLKFIYDNDINSCIPMLYRLLELIVTIPSIAEPLEGRACVSNRIRDYCRRQRNEEPRSALALLVIENELFRELEKTSEWYSQVTDHFATLFSTSSIELIYKVDEASGTPKTEAILEPELSIKPEPDMF